MKTVLLALALIALPSGINNPVQRAQILNRLLAQPQIFSATSTAITGTLATAGSCTTPQAVKIVGVKNTMAVIVTPQTRTAGARAEAWIPAAGNGVLVVVCATVANVTLTSSVYNVRVIQ